MTGLFTSKFYFGIFFSLNMLRLTALPNSSRNACQHADSKFNFATYEPCSIVNTRTTTFFVISFQ